MRRLIDAGAVLFAIGLAALYLTGDVLDADEAIFASIAERMRVFGLPVYQAGWDHKPPGVFLIYRWLLPLGPEGSLIGPRIGMALAWIATAVLLGLAARRLFGRAGFAPAVIGYALLRSFGEAKAGAANTEAFLQVPLVAAGWLLLAPCPRPRLAALGGGALLAVAALLKPPAAVFGPAAVAAVFLLRGGRPAWTTAWCGLAGAAGVFALEGLRVLAGGDAQGWWICNVVANAVYVEHGPAHGVGDLAAGLFDEMVRAPAPWLLALIGGAAALRCPGLPSPLAEEGAPARRILAAGTVLLAAGAFLVTLGGNFFRHYWLLVHPVLALFVAAGVVALLGTPRAWWRVGLLVVIVALGWLPAQRTDKRRLLRTLRENPYRAPDVDATARALARLTAPGETVFVWGIQPELYLYSHRTPATRMVTCAFLSGSLRHDVRVGEHPPEPDTIPGAWDLLIQDLDRYRPRAVVDTSPGGRAGYDRIPPRSMPRLREYLDAHYVLEGRHGVADVYLRRD